MAASTKVPPAAAAAVLEAMARTGLEARPYQQRIMGRTIGYYQAGLRSIMIESPTGSGKTPMCLLIAKLVQEQFNYSVGWMSLSRELRIQAEKENGEKGIKADIQFFSMFEKKPPKVDFLIHDECQHDAADSAANIHNYIEPKLILGPTATPFRTDRIKLCFEKVIKGAGIGALIKQGYLSQFRHFVIPNWKPETVTSVYLERLHTCGPTFWGKTFMFFLTEALCQQALSMLAGTGIRAEVITAKTDRERQLDWFKAGRLDLLIGIRTISEGVNVPELGTVFCRDSSRGPTIQMAGRVFRKHPDRPLKNLVQSVNSKHPFTKTAAPVEQWLLNSDDASFGDWRSITANPNLTRLANRNALKSVQVHVSIPDFIVKKIGKRRARLGWQDLARTNNL